MSLREGDRVLVVDYVDLEGDLVFDSRHRSPVEPLD